MGGKLVEGGGIKGKSIPSQWVQMDEESYHQGSANRLYICGTQKVICGTRIHKVKGRVVL